LPKPYQENSGRGAASIALETLGLTRRQLLQIAALAGGGAGLASACTEEQIQRIADRPVRKNIATLSPSDPIVTTYAAAIRAMQALPSTDPRNWHRQAQIHNDFCRHSSWLILPWHRAYLWYFEEICRELTGRNDFALPYWDWTTNPQIPAVFWDESSTLFHPSRTATPSSSAPDFTVGPPVIDNILSETNFIALAGDPVARHDTAEHGPAAGPLETTPHNGIHNFVGGDMGTLMSPLDPIFWTHHGRVDRLWVEWNILRNNSNPNDTAWTTTEFTDFVDRKGNPARISVLTTVLLPYLSYRYDTQVESPTSPINSSENDELKKRLQKGAKVTLDQRSRFTAPTSSIDGTQPVTLHIPGGENLAGRMSELGNGATARVSLEFSYSSTTSFAVLVFVNSPNGNQQTATGDPGFVGSVSFFDAQMEMAHKRTETFRLSATNAARANGQGPLEVTLVPVSLSGRPLEEREDVEVTTSIDLLVSTIDVPR
jgi:tyrosinase